MRTTVLGLLVAVSIVVFARGIVYGRQFAREPAWAHWAYLGLVVGLMLVAALLVLAQRP